MDTASEDDELIDMVVRLPRKTVEESLLAARPSSIDAADRRLSEAKMLILGHRRRAGCFAGVRFCDPSWEMILHLYVAFREEKQLAVSQLCSISGGSTTTALRHIEHLEGLGYIVRQADDADRRRAHVSMLPPLVEAIEQWLDLQIAAAEIGC